jgi:Ca-activated chloride channel family protein
MHRLSFFLSVLAMSSICGLAFAQEGPIHEGSENVAKPRKKTSDTDATPPPNSDQAPIPSKLSPKNKPAVSESDPSFKVESNLVTLDVAVLDNRGNFIPNIPRGNFRVLEDNVPQPIKSFSKGEAPMTVALLIEFSNLFQSYWSQGWYETLTAVYGFTQTLKPEDYVAIIAYDMRSEILSDFTQDKRKINEALSRLRIPGFSESNLFDALVDTEERMKDIEGRKAIILVASGRDTFSKLTFDKTRKRVQEAGVPIYAFSLLQALRQRADAGGYMGPLARMDFLQADNEMKTFAKDTGGMAFFPVFIGEYSNIFRSISDALRNEYTLGYEPSNTARDGKFRKIKVELVNPATNEPLPIKDEKGKPIKYQILAKAGYTAPRTVE